MLLIIFLGLLVKLTSVSGYCNNGTQTAKNFNFTEVSISVLTRFLKKVTLKNFVCFTITLCFHEPNTNRPFETSYVRVIEIFMHNYLLIVRKEISPFLIKTKANFCMNSQWKYPKKRNHNFQNYLHRLFCFTDCNSSESNRGNIMKFNNWIFFKSMWQKVSSCEI
jgi:hypothetical protein